MARIDPYGITVDSSGSLFIAETLNNRVRKVTPAGLISTVAGNGVSGFSGDGASATAANLGYPRRVAVDSAGNLYIADSSNQRVRMVARVTGMISTVAGNGASGGVGDNDDGLPASSARVGFPTAVAIDKFGLLIATNRRIREVPLGAQTAVAPAPLTIAQGQNRFETAANIAQSAENNAQIIIDDYLRYLGREPEPAGLAFWLQQFDAGLTNEDLIAGFTGSEEYFQTHAKL